MDTRADHPHAPIVVSIHADEVTADDLQLYRDTLERALRFTASDTVSRVEVFINPRGIYASEPEWLEHCILVRYTDDSRAPFRLGCIQRTIGAPSEFHS